MLIIGNADEIFGPIYVRFTEVQLDDTIPLFSQLVGIWTFYSQYMDILFTPLNS